MELSFDSGENEVLFVKVGARVPKLRLDTSGPKWPKFSLQATDPKAKVFFGISRFYLCYDSVKNEVLFVKIGARILDLWLDTPFGINV